MPDAAVASTSASGARPARQPAEGAVALWRAGEFDDGVAAFRSALQAHGIAWPDTARARTWSVRWARLRSQWTALPKVPPATAGPTDGRLDALWWARLCIGDVDPERAEWLAATHHQAARAAHAADHVAYSLAWDAVDLARSEGRAGADETRRLLEGADRLAPPARAGAPAAWVSLARAHVALAAGDFRGGRAAFERATALKEAVQAGAPLFAGLVDTGRAECVAAMGDLRALRADWSTWSAAARARGDSVGEAILHAVVAPRVCLADADPAAARRALTAVVLPAACGSVHVRTLRLVAACDVDLYEGVSESARAPFDTAVRALRKAGAARWDALWAVLNYTHGRLALAAAGAAASGGDASAVSALEVASEAHSTTEESANRPARALADTLTAGLAELSGNTMSAAGALRRAQVEFDATHMGLHAACCRLVRSWIGDASPRDEADALAYMATEGVLDPLAMMRVVLPGLGKRRAPPARAG